MSDALRHITAKRVLPLAFSSREIEETLPKQIAARAMFSARTVHKTYLEDTLGNIGRIVQPAVIRQADGTLRRAGKGESVSPAKVRTLMQQQLRSLGYQPNAGEEGTLKDLSSDRRTALIINMQTGMARGYARDRAVQTQAILQTFPADRLYRAAQRNKKRKWARKWNDARRNLGETTQATVAGDDDLGPFIAPKDDPIWSAISRFGNPYSPFDYNSGMRKRSVLASEARKHGITRTPQPAADPLDADLSAPIRPNTPPAMLEAIMQSFPGAIATARRIYWIPDPVDAAASVISAAERGAQMRTSIAFLDADKRAAVSDALKQDIPEQTAFALESNQVRHILAEHTDADREMRNYGVGPVDPADIAHFAELVAKPTRILPSGRKLARQGKPLLYRCERQGRHYECVMDYTTGAKLNHRPSLRLYTMYRIDKTKAGSSSAIRNWTKE